MKFADPKSDIAFKKIFENESKKEILISFLNAVLDLKGEKEIKEVRILDPHQPPVIKDMKGTIVDVKVKDARGITFIVEMQVEASPFFDRRLLYYASHAYVSQIGAGEDYPRLNQVIFIGILDFEMFEGDDYLTRHLILNTKTLKQEIKDMEFNFIELPKFDKKENDLKTITDKWIYFLKNADNLKIIPKTLESTEEIVEAFEIANRHEWTSGENAQYLRWELKLGEDKIKLEEAKKKGYEEGMEKGMEQGVKDTARKMLSENISIDNIIKCTGLTEECIKSLKNE